MTSYQLDPLPLRLWVPVMPVVAIMASGLMELLMR
jgi:hypothetical protein